MRNSSYYRVTGYDIIGFVETWAKSNDDMCNTLPGYSCFSTIRPKYSHKGRYSGGAAIYIRRELVSGIERINEIKLADSVFVKLSSIFFNLERDDILGVLYISPERSVYHKISDRFGYEALGYIKCN